MMKKRRQNKNDAAELTMVLHAHEEALLKIPGVTGCGIGLAGRGQREQVVIQIFLKADALESQVQAKVTELLEGYPIEFIEMTTPNAD